MNTTEVAALFRTYCDEPDESFLSTADVGLYCKLGYAQFLAYVDEFNPNVRLRGTVITLNNAQRYDLSQANSLATAAGTPSILGPNPNTINAGGVAWNELPRMTKLVTIYSMNATTQVPLTVYNIVNNLEAVTPHGNSNTVQWAGSTLTFSVAQTATFMILYNYEQEIGLTNNIAVGVPAGQPGQTWLDTTGAIANIVIDDNLQQWHDMIALFAYDQYAIADLSSNPILNQRLAQRKVEFREYLMQRSSASMYVNHSSDPARII